MDSLQPDKEPWESEVRMDTDQVGRSTVFTMDSYGRVKEEIMAWREDHYGAITSLSVMLHRLEDRRMEYLRRLRERDAPNSAAKLRTDLWRPSTGTHPCHKRNDCRYGMGTSI